MGQVNHQDARDVTIYRAWVDGARQDELGRQYGVTHQAISQAIARVADSLPPVEKDQEVRRTIVLADDLMSCYVDKARNGNTAASREVRGYLMLKARWLGIDRQPLQVQGQVEHLHSWVPGPSVAEVLEQWREQGILKAEITRAP